MLKTKSLLIGVIGLALLFALWPTAGADAGPNLPPRPTLVPTSVPLPIAITGASIELLVPTSSLNYYTVVQWQSSVDHLWHTVISWQGNLDDTVPNSTPTLAYKRWWVYDTNFGQQNFRWQVFDKPNGKLLVTSATFNLPTHSGQTVISQVTLP
jgi:hypothetical protein